MNTEQIAITNLSCGGCANTITKNLLAIEGVENVKVAIASSIVTVSFDNTTNRQLICQKLLAIGYPEINKKNGLLTQLKSVKSCVAGKLSN